MEEEILQDRAWRGDSPVWGALRESRDGAPSCEDVSITTHQDNGTKANGSGPQPYRSPVVHQRVRMLMESDPAKKGWCFFVCFFLYEILFIVCYVALLT